MLAQGPEAKERTRDIPPSLGWLALEFCLLRLYTQCLFLSQPQTSSSVLVRVPSERLSHLTLPDFLNLNGIYILSTDAVLLRPKPKQRFAQHTACRFPTNSILSSSHCFPSSVSPWFSPQWALPFCPSTNSFVHFKAHTGLLSRELCSSQPHTEIAHACSKNCPLPCMTFHVSFLLSHTQCW